MHITCFACGRASELTVTIEFFLATTPGVLLRTLNGARCVMVCWIVDELFDRPVFPSSLGKVLRFRVHYYVTDASSKVVGTKLVRADVNMRRADMKRWQNLGIEGGVGHLCG